MVVDVEAEVADVVEGILGRVHRHVPLRRVQHVGHTHAPQVLQVLHMAQRVVARFDQTLGGTQRWAPKRLVLGCVNYK